VEIITSLQKQIREVVQPVHGKMGQEVQCLSQKEGNWGGILGPKRELDDALYLLAFFILN